MRRTLITAWLLVSGVILASCSGDEGGFGYDPSPPPDDEVSSCAPVIGDLSFARGSDTSLGSFIRTSLNYEMGDCGATIEKSSVRVQITNLDAPDPDAAEANAWYDLPTTSTYVLTDTAEKTLSVDFSIPDETTTYEFNVKLIDSQGFPSNKLSEEVVYQDIIDEI